ncbi:two-component sensor histidine kinase [Streptomyces sp. OF3]|uniref:histidine kinase n=1 Tax=Streptomyces alkaliterrae TaxID=2213162 RepID=A0A7W3WIJ1_9ACTN|nr:histidine kinase [Streptomyces alkaliterrae]MBB1253008.1 two-component sensor histidine kinase [Streptomyces alkaliterrae]
MAVTLARPHRDDVLIAACGAAGGLALWLLGLFTNPRLAERHGELALVTLAVMCVAVLGRRVAQPWALLLAVPTVVADAFTGSVLATLVLFTDVVYAAALYGRPRLSRALLPSSVVLSVAVTVAALAASRRPEAVVLGIVCALVTAAPAGTGVLVRQHRDRAAAERLRAEQTALLAEMDRKQAVHAERARMARELHDLVAGHLSAIALHSTAAQSLDEPAATKRALAVIRENSVHGLAEMRRLISLLRSEESEDGSAPAPAAVPKLAGLPALLQRVEADGGSAGLVFELHDDLDGRPLPAPVELAAYRLVQESLTNALKHAAPGRVRVRLAEQVTGEAGREGPALLVSVSSPLGGPAEPRAPGSGSGLVGMRERVALLGGVFDAGERDGSWLVRALLPLDEGGEK